MSRMLGELRELCCYQDLQKFCCYQQLQEMLLPGGQPLTRLTPAIRLHLEEIGYLFDYEDCVARYGAVPGLYCFLELVQSDRDHDDCALPYDYVERLEAEVSAEVVEVVSDGDDNNEDPYLRVFEYLYE